MINYLMNQNPVTAYLSTVRADKVDTNLLAYLCALSEISKTAPEMKTSAKG
jgi:hypothetical protein